MRFIVRLNRNLGVVLTPSESRGYVVGWLLGALFLLWLFGPYIVKFLDDIKDIIK